MPSPMFCGRRPPIFAACLALGVLCWSVAARADEVVVKGTRLDGTVVGVTASSIRFETSYGKGAIEIAYADIQALTTARAFVILFGENGEARGRSWGVAAGNLLVGPDPGAAAPVPVASIHHAAAAEAFDAAAVERVRRPASGLDTWTSASRTRTPPASRPVSFLSSADLRRS